MAILFLPDGTRVGRNGPDGDSGLGYPAAQVYRKKPGTKKTGTGWEVSAAHK